MVAADVLAAMRRRWYVVVVGVLVVAVACLGVRRAEGVYWTQVDDVFLAPQNAYVPNSLEFTSQSVISTAGVVAIRVNERHPSASLGSSDASLVGEGVRRGSSVRLPNAGGQWADNFNRPVLDVQVVGPTRDAVKADLDALLAEIDAELARLQDDAGVAPAFRVTTQHAPTSPVIQYVGAQATRAMAGVAIVGLALTTLVAVGWDRLALKRSRLRARRSSVPAATAPEPA